MKERFNLKNINLIWAGSFLLPLLLFWVILLIKVPYSFTQYFHTYSLGLFLIILILYYLCFGSPKRYGGLICLSLTMVLLALSLSYQWTSGFSDNGIIDGLLPYKDGKNYYFGANLILNGLSPINASQSTERPLFPGFLAFMLFLTGQNLEIALAMIAQLVGIGLYLSARQIRNTFGALAASLCATLLYFYIQPLIGNTMSEMLGFIAGCFGFAIIWLASYNPKWSDLLLGLTILMVAISARAGAFFIFPMLAIWIGWVFRGEKQFSLKMAAYAFAASLIGYFLVNSIYSHILGIPSGYSFGNFSYAIYGQVRGGTGWHSAIEEVGTRNPSVVYRAALIFFLKHPISLFVGFAKSYRDFFLLGDSSIFPFGDYSLQNWPNIVLWAGILTLFVLGLVQLFKSIRSNLPSLLVAGFIGIFLSIPFLPPIDGGARFYASTMPFLFALPAVGISRFSKNAKQNTISNNNLQNELTISRPVSVIVIAITLIAPLAIYSFSRKPVYTLPVCPLQQKPFVMEFHSGSYIDLIKPGSTQCGLAPEVCLNDFKTNNTQKAIDDYYQTLLFLAENNNTNVRIISAINLIENKPHYFYISHDKISSDLSPGLISGCAVEILTKYQSIYQVETISPGIK